MKRVTTSFLLSAVLISSLFLNQFQPASAAERKKASWLASCPEVVDSTPQLPTPKTLHMMSPSSQPFKLLAKDSTEFVTQPQSILGCYVNEESVVNPNTSPEWQIGTLNRDLQGYYFQNRAGITWRLTLNAQTLTLEIQPGSPYYSKGAGFQLDFVRQSDCKVRQFFNPYILSLGFPRNSARVPQLGVTKNLILVVDFPDAPLGGSLDAIVENVIAPKVVENFFFQSSNGKFRPIFTIFPTVIRLASLEKSFAPNSAGKFFVDGVQQDIRLIREAVELAKAKGSLDGYTSINVFAPTANSMGYYGSAHLGISLDVGDRKIYDVQLLGGTIGTVKSFPPSWKVFAHEYGHLLGMYDYYIPGIVNSGKSPGPFDLMGNTSGTANSFFGFQRWVQGWIDDSDVICDFTINTSSVHTLSPLNQIAGKKLYVHPLDGSTALVVEYRTDSEFDTLQENAGLLVYIIDMKVATGYGPISIQPSEQDLVLNPRDDVVRYSTAPLSTGQFVRVGDLVVFADQVGTKEASFRVFTKAEFAAKQEVDAKVAAEVKAVADKMIADAKAAAELKARQEAEAKAAAELKARQEAEAKAAAELKARQEADAKAAADLKAKQEAEARAAAELKAKQESAADKAALAKAQSELSEANAALADSQKVNRELQSQLSAIESQFKLLSDSVAVIQNQLSQLNAKFVAALAGQNAANAKLKKVCSAKPKPKGC
jgi:M6 family metalloprotease-like protein